MVTKRHIRILIVILLILVVKLEAAQMTIKN